MKSLRLHKIAICILLPFMLLQLAPVVRAQNPTLDVTKAIEENAEWSEGTVFLADGKELKGLLRLNTKTGLLGFESGATSKTFNPRTALGFEYYDAVQLKTRSYISVEYENPDPPKNNPFSTEKGTQLAAKAPQFFEVIMELPTFVLLSTFSQMQIESKGFNPINPVNNSTPTNTIITPVYTSTSYSQTETLLIMDANGKLLPVLKVTNTESDAWLIDSKKSKSKNIDDDDVFKTYTAPYFAELEKYAKENKLSFKKKDDLMKILAHYKSLIED